MATLATYAEVVTAESLSTQLFRAGIRKSPPGMLLKDILTVSGGEYRGVVELPAPIQQHFRDIAAVSGDAEIARIADAGRLVVPLDQFQGMDPETTRIAFGYKIGVTPEESARLGLKHTGPYDPRTTLKLPRP